MQWKISGSEVSSVAECTKGMGPIVLFDGEYSSSEKV